MRNHFRYNNKKRADPKRLSHPRLTSPQNLSPHHYPFHFRKMLNINGCRIKRGPSQSQKVFSSMLQGMILSTSGTRTRKSSNQCPRVWFCWLLEPGRESLQIDAPGCDFIDFWSQGQKVMKMLLQDVILLTSGARARKSWNQCSRVCFSWLLEPGPESLKINTPGSDFVDF